MDYFPYSSENRSKTTNPAAVCERVVIKAILEIQGLKDDQCSVPSGVAFEVMAIRCSCLYANYVYLMLMVLR